MAQWNQTEKILHAKIVYYGPALSGKTTNLQQVHRFTDPKGENHLISLNTASDRTLFFDLLPLDPQSEVLVAEGGDGRFRTADRDVELGQPGRDRFR